MENISQTPVDDESYLVRWKRSTGIYSGIHRVYYCAEENKFFSCEGNYMMPIHVDVYCEIPKVTDEGK